MSCGVGCRRSSDPALLWLWSRLAATALVRPLAWEPPYAAGAAQEMAKRQKKKKGNSKGVMISKIPYETEQGSVELLGTSLSVSPISCFLEISFSPHGLP